jgi:uncharacterized membrane protein YdcZ (DUF606 family)
LSLYQRMRAHKNKPEFWIMLLIAGVIVALSFGQTAKLAEMVGATEWYKKIGFAVLVEILFTISLLTRANQRARGKHVPWFLNVGYYGMLTTITVINITVLYRIHPIAGPFVGGLISAAMLYTESLFVWLNTDADKPHQKSLRSRKREAKRQVKEMKEIQKIEWLKWEAQKPDLKLIRMARKAEEKRKEVVGDGLPEFFLQLQKKEPIKEIVAELHETQPKTVDVQDQKEAKELVPFRRQIGFHMERTDHAADPKPKSPAPRFQPNMEARAKAIETAKKLKEELGRLPKQRELMENGLSEYYAKWARQELKKHV